MSARRIWGFRKFCRTGDTSQCPVCQPLGISNFSGSSCYVSLGFSSDSQNFCLELADNVGMTYLASITLSVKLSISISSKNVKPDRVKPSTLRILWNITSYKLFSLEPADTRKQQACPGYWTRGSVSIVNASCSVSWRGGQTFPDESYKWFVLKGWKV